MAAKSIKIIVHKTKNNDVSRKAPFSCRNHCNHVS